MEIDKITQQVLDVIDEEGFKQEGAYNLRHNGYALCHGDTEHIKIKKRTDGHQGIDVYISSEAKDETVHIPVVVTNSGVTDLVYNDFYVEDGRIIKTVPTKGYPVNDGFSCIKGLSLSKQQTTVKPNALPKIRQADGSFKEVSWDEGFQHVANKIK